MKKSTAEPYYAKNSGQTVYCTYDGFRITRVQYEALCYLMEECRLGNISKADYNRARRNIVGQ